MSKFADKLCPHCGDYSVAVYFDPYAFQCENCGSRWKLRTDYENEILGMTTKVDYINSGDLRQDIDQLVEAVELNLLKSLEVFLPTLDDDADGLVSVDEVVQVLKDFALRRRKQG